jgi:hypothetical protein
MANPNLSKEGLRPTFEREHIGEHLLLAFFEHIVLPQFWRYPAFNLHSSSKAQTQFWRYHSSRQFP